MIPITNIPISRLFFPKVQQSIHSGDNPPKALDSIASSLNSSGIWGQMYEFSKLKTIRQYWRQVMRAWILERARMEEVPKVLRIKAMRRQKMLEGVLLMLEMKIRMVTQLLQISLWIPSSMFTLMLFSISYWLEMLVITVREGEWEDYMWSLGEKKLMNWHDLYQRMIIVRNMMQATVLRAHSFLDMDVPKMQKYHFHSRRVSQEMKSFVFSSQRTLEEYCRMMKVMITKVKQGLILVCRSASHFDTSPLTPSISPLITLGSNNSSLFSSQFLSFLPLQQSNHCLNLSLTVFKILVPATNRYNSLLSLQYFTSTIRMISNWLIVGDIAVYNPTITQNSFMQIIEIPLTTLVILCYRSSSLQSIYLMYISATLSYYSCSSSSLLWYLLMILQQSTTRQVSRSWMKSRAIMSWNLVMVWKQFWAGLSTARPRRCWQVQRNQNMGILEKSLQMVGNLVNQKKYRVMMRTERITDIILHILWRRVLEPLETYIRNIKRVQMRISPDETEKVSMRTNPMVMIYAHQISVLQQMMVITVTSLFTKILQFLTNSPTICLDSVLQILLLQVQYWSVITMDIRRGMKLKFQEIRQFSLQLKETPRSQKSQMSLEMRREQRQRRMRKELKKSIRYFQFLFLKDLQPYQEPWVTKRRRMMVRTMWKMFTFRRANQNKRARTMMKHHRSQRALKLLSPPSRLIFQFITQVMLAETRNSLKEGQQERKRIALREIYRIPLIKGVGVLNWRQKKQMQMGISQMVRGRRKQGIRKMMLQGSVSTVSYQIQQFSIGSVVALGSEGQWSQRVEVGFMTSVTRQGGSYCISVSIGGWQLPCGSVLFPSKNSL